MKRLKSSYFGQTFTLFFTSSLLLLAILTILVSYFFFQTYSEKITEECESTVENVGMTLQNVMAEYQEALQTLEDSSNVQRFLSGETDTSMQKTIARQLYSIKNQMSTRAELSIVELEKGVWSSTSTYNESIRIENCMNWGVFREAQDADDVIVYAVPKDLVLEDDVRIAFAKACRDDEGELQGFLLVELSRTLISDIVTECAGSYNTAVMMVNANGSIVYHSSGTDYEGRNKLEAYGEEDELKTASGKKTVWGNYACYYSETLDLYILQEYPSDVTSILKRVITNSICFGILAVIFLSLGFSALMAQSVSAPIRKLRASVEEIRNGNLALRVSVDREDELGMLEESFNHMLDEINQLMVNIDEEKHSLWLAETKSLNLQMNPHFLYNTLDLIKWSVKLNRPHEAEMLAVNLAKLLRKIMDIQEDLVSLSSELDLIDTFVALQNIHFNNELKLKYDIPEEMLHLQVPKLGLQPLVENAVVHGFKQKETDCRIQIIGKCEKEYLLITVRDNGTGMTQQELQAVLTSKGENGYHIGLRNVERRAKLYGDDSCGLFLDDAWEMGTAITLRLRKQRQNGI